MYSSNHDDRNCDLSHAGNTDIIRTPLYDYRVYYDNVSTIIELELRDNKVIFLNCDNFNTYKVKQYKNMSKEAVETQNKRYFYVFC